MNGYHSRYATKFIVCQPQNCVYLANKPKKLPNTSFNATNPNVPSSGRKCMNSSKKVLTKQMYQIISTTNSPQGYDTAAIQLPPHKSQTISLLALQPRHRPNLDGNNCTMDGSHMWSQVICHHNPDIPKIRYLSKIMSIIWSTVIQILQPPPTPSR